MMRNGSLLCVSLLLAAGFASCNSDPAPAAAGPVDGTYTLTSETCAGAAHNGAVGSTLTVTNTTATFVATTGSCTTTYGITLAYSGTNGVVTQQVSKSCSSGCGGSCMANNTAEPVISGTYSKSGSTLTLDFTNFICASD